MSIPEPVAPLIDLLRDGLPRMLEADLTGVYLYGSLLGSDFVSIRSDVDCIVVTERPLDEARFQALSAWLSAEREAEPWLDRLQMSFLVRDRVLEDDPAACLYQFGELTRSGSDGNPIIWLDYLQRGHRLWGAEARSFLPRITERELHAALVREVGYLREELVLKKDSKWRGQLTYLAYAVLTLCRILYSASTGTVASKADAAAWALPRVPKEFIGLIERALTVSRADGLEPLAANEIGRLLDHVQSTLG